jgi:hypothetical protein
MTRRSKREIERMLDDLEEDHGTTPSRGSGVVYTNGDGYVTPDGEPVPTDESGDPDFPQPSRGPTIILREEYALDAPGDREVTRDE